jgi:hypothetical protein
MGLCGKYTMGLCSKYTVGLLHAALTFDWDFVSGIPNTRSPWDKDCGCACRDIPAEMYQPLPHLKECCLMGYVRPGDTCIFTVCLCLMGYVRSGDTCADLLTLTPPDVLTLTSPDVSRLPLLMFFYKSVRETLLHHLL